MAMRSELFGRVTIVGVGLIGGSLGIAIKKKQLAREVVGFSQKQTSLMTALKNGAIDQAQQDVVKAVHHADLVVLATPVSIITNMLSILGPHLKRGCIVTDVGSVKGVIVNAAHAHLPPHAFFVGSHPMAGSEKKGVQFADGGLFANSLCFMTPTEKTNKGVVERVRRLWAAVGANVKFMSPEEHDKILGYVSHLPHMVAYSLISAIPSTYLEYAGQGLKDTTRVASSSPQMWNDICMGNSKNILNAIDEVVKKLSILRKSIGTSDQKALGDLLKEAKDKRDTLI